jgi:hypothetical protein
VTIRLSLSGEVPDDLLTQIQNGWVALTFGSPDTYDYPTVSDASSTMMLLGLAMLGLASIRRKMG